MVKICSIALVEMPPPTDAVFLAQGLKLSRTDL